MTKEIFGEIRKWFVSEPERRVMFTYGLLFGKGMTTFVLPNLMTFLTNVWNLNLKQASLIVNLQEGLRNMLQIPVAFCIDARLGYTRMLIHSSVLYSTGLALLAFSAPQCFSDNEKVCRPTEKVDCFEKLKHTPFWIGLVLLIIGRAAQVIPLYSLSFGQTEVIKAAPRDSKPTRVQIGCFSREVKVGGQLLQTIIIRWLCYGFLMLGSLASVYGFISKLKWHERCLISAKVIGIGLLWFVCGTFSYGGPQLEPSPLSAMLRTFVAATRKRHLNYQGNSEQLYHGDGKENLRLTDHLAWLNKAALKESQADDNSMMERKRWRFCTVKEVEQTKLLLNIIPMSVAFIGYGMVKSLGSTFFIEQANSVKGVCPIVVFQMIKGLASRTANKGYKMVLGEQMKRIGGKYSVGVKIGLGMFFGLISVIVASLVGNEGLDPMAAFWLVPQFYFLGAMDGLAGDGIKDFFRHYAPDSRRYAPIFTSTLTGCGILSNMGFIIFLDYYSKSKCKASWVGDNINQSRLDIIYRAYVIVAMINLVFYIFLATQYSYDNTIGGQEEEGGGGGGGGGIPILEVEEEAGGDQVDKQSNQGQVDIELQMISARD